MLVKEKVKNLPLTPGVYLMKDSAGRIIYVGKAKNLKRRVQTYFQKSNAHPQKIKKVVSNIEDFDYIVTDTEFEAFMLECKLIKEIKPLFNKKMKSTESYVYIVIHLDEALPKIEVTNHPIKKDGKVNYGPFVSRSTVEKVVLAIKESYKILCSTPSKKGTRCLNYSLGLCIGVCQANEETVTQYKKIILSINRLLEGTELRLLKELEEKMLIAAEKLDFLTAAKYRDQLDVIHSLINKEKVIEFIEENQNILMIEFLGEDTFKLFLIKRNKILFSEKYHVENVNNVQLIISQLMNCLEVAAKTSTDSVSKDELDEAQIIYSYVNSQNCHSIMIPDSLLVNGDSTIVNEILLALQRSSDRVKIE